MGPGGRITVPGSPRALPSAWPSPGPASPSPVASTGAVALISGARGHVGQEPCHPAHRTVPSIPARPRGSWHPRRCAEANAWGKWERFPDPALKTAQGPVHRKSQPVAPVWGWGNSMAMPRAAKGKPRGAFLGSIKTEKDTVAMPALAQSRAGCAGVGWGLAWCHCHRAPALHPERCHIGKKTDGREGTG